MLLSVDFSESGTPAAIEALIDALRRCLDLDWHFYGENHALPTEPYLSRGSPSVNHLPQTEVSPALAVIEDSRAALTIVEASQADGCTWIDQAAAAITYDAQMPTDQIAGVHLRSVLYELERVAQTRLERVDCEEADSLDAMTNDDGVDARLEFLRKEAREGSRLRRTLGELRNVWDWLAVTAGETESQTHDVPPMLDRLDADPNDTGAARTGGLVQQNNSDIAG